MWRVGDHIRVSVGTTETRKAVVACVNDTPNEIRSYDVILFDSYGDSTASETVGEEELERVPSSRIQPLLAWESAPRIDIQENVTTLRSKGADMFRVHDWLGAVTMFEQLLCHLEMSEFFLFRVKQGIRLGRIAHDTRWFDYGEIDPLSDTVPPQFRVPTESENNAMDQDSLNDSKFFISTDPRLQTSSLLNVGRALINMGKFEDGIAKLSYAIYVACLVPEEGKLLKTKSFFWRGKARLAMGKASPALRDADAAHTLASQIGDVPLINECRILVNESRSMAEESRKSTLRISRELMKLCDTHMSLD